MNTARKALGLLAPAALLALPLSAALPATAGAQQQQPATYQATLNPLNNSSGSGQFMMEVTGTQAKITQQVSGVAATFQDAAYPHVQHIHIGGQGTCPDPSADTDGDGVVDTMEGQPAYGMIGTTLSVSGDTSPDAATDVSIAPSGDSYEYSRTIDLSPDTLASLEAGTAVVVVHGLDPATLSQQAQDAKSDLVPELPLAATAPTLCGAVTASQMSQIPSGSVDTGGGSSAGVENAWLLGVGASSLLAAGGLLAVTRRRDQQPAGQNN